MGLRVRWASLVFSLGFIPPGHNILLRGPSGMGKTMLAKILGYEALLAGFTVRFITLAAALADLLQQESLPAFERRIKRYLQPQLLILDELGYLPCDSHAADLLLTLPASLVDALLRTLITSTAAPRSAAAIIGIRRIGTCASPPSTALHLAPIDCHFSTDLVRRLHPASPPLDALARARGSGTWGN